MARTKQPSDAILKRILDVLDERYRPSHPKAKIDATREQYGTIWLRIIDPTFEGMEMEDRWNDLRRALDALPEDTEQEITMEYCLSPKEVKGRYNLMNLDFEDALREFRDGSNNGKLAGRAPVKSNGLKKTRTVTRS